MNDFIGTKKKNSFLAVVIIDIPFCVVASMSSNEQMEWGFNGLTKVVEMSRMFSNSKYLSKNSTVFCLIAFSESPSDSTWLENVQRSAWRE